MFTYRKADRTCSESIFNKRWNKIHLI